MHMLRAAGATSRLPEARQKKYTGMARGRRAALHGRSRRLTATKEFGLLAQLRRDLVLLGGLVKM